MFKKTKKLEMLVRMENAGLTIHTIAAMLCVSTNRIIQIKKSPDYLIARMKITHGLILDQDMSLATIKEQRREMMTQLLPAALQVLANEIQRPTNTLAERKHQAAVAQDLMDREGTFAKISKTEVKPVDEFSFGMMDAESKKVIDTIKQIAPPAPGAEEIRATIEENIEFTNGRTINTTEQQAALSELEEEAKLLDSVPPDAPVN
jgi:methyl-accepting chemotaxis protein